MFDMTIMSAFIDNSIKNFFNLDFDSCKAQRQKCLQLLYIKYMSEGRSHRFIYMLSFFSTMIYKYSNRLFLVFYSGNYINTKEKFHHITFFSYIDTKSDCRFSSKYTYNQFLLACKYTWQLNL